MMVSILSASLAMMSRSRRAVWREVGVGVSDINSRLSWLYEKEMLVKVGKPGTTRDCTSGQNDWDAVQSLNILFSTKVSLGRPHPDWELG